MQDIYALLRQDERVTLALRALYEKYGYRKFRMNRFEEYDFYAVHRDFLANGQIISFTDLDGKLMALRPDVTLSIVKKAESGASDRLYYTESVFRPAGGDAGYRESFQVGVEFIGQLTAYATAEVISLAAQSLSQLSPDYVLDLSHTGFISGLMDTLPLDTETKMAILPCIEGKNAHELSQLVAGRLPQADIDRLIAVTTLSGSFQDALPKARSLANHPDMTAAVDELEALHATLSASGESGPLRLDFSISSDAKYYSGLRLRGYISGVPSAVLSGGRYDPLLRRMGKPNLSAMGFAIYFDELARYLSQEEDARVDTAILYREDTNPAAVAHMVQSRIARGERVWAGTALPTDLAYGQILEVDGHA